MKKNIYISILMFLISFQIAYALEINTYPPILGYTITEASTFTDYVSYVFMFLIAISTVILVAVIILGGIDFILAGGSPGKASQAKKKIKDGFIGMIILLLCYIILNTINPGIVIENPDLEKCLGGGIIITVEKLGFPTKKICIYDSMPRLDIDGTVTDTQWTYKDGDLKEVWVYSDYNYKNPINHLFQDNTPLTDGPMPGGPVPSNTKSIFILKNYPGLYLYDNPNFESNKYPPLYVGLRDLTTLNNASLDLNYRVDYDNLASSLCLIWDKSYPDMSYRAILFEDVNYSGECLIAGWKLGLLSTSMISMIGFIKPGIDDNSLSSVLTYKADINNDYGKIILYNKTNCVSEDSIKDQCELQVNTLEGHNVSPWSECPSFEGDVKSAVIQGKAGFVIRATDDYCMYFDVETNKGNNCVNLENTRVFYESGCAEYDPDTLECIKPVNIRPKEILLTPIN